MAFDRKLDETIPMQPNRMHVHYSRPAVRRARHSRVLLGLVGALVLAFSPAGSRVAYAGYEGGSNTAYGTNALPISATNTGTGNSAFGVNALLSNTSGQGDSAFGQDALHSNTEGIHNTASGQFALHFNTKGCCNTASGFSALELNIMGSSNMASGYLALHNNTGGGNTASGADALVLNTTGNYNTAVGADAGLSSNIVTGNTTGSSNTFIGSFSGPGTSTEINNATAIGANALVLGAVGANVGVNTTTPQSTFQVGGSNTTYGSYLQIPIISSNQPPPAADCNGTTFLGRMVLQFTGHTSRDLAGPHLWACSPPGMWERVS